MSLDVFRGLTVALMILVNNPGSWAHIHSPLRHAAWHGLTPDRPGVSLFPVHRGGGHFPQLSPGVKPPAPRVVDLVRKIAIRSVIIFSLGLFLNGFPFNVPLNLPWRRTFTWSSLAEVWLTLRFPGVLQRIALCYLLAGMTVVLTAATGIGPWSRSGFLVLYELLMRLPLVPGWGSGSFELVDNFVRWADLRLLGEAHLYRVEGMCLRSRRPGLHLAGGRHDHGGFFYGRIHSRDPDL